MANLIRFAFVAFILAWNVSDSYACDCRETGCQRDSNGDVCAAR